MTARIPNSEVGQPVSFEVVPTVEMRLTEIETLLTEIRDLLKLNLASPISVPAALVYPYEPYRAPDNPKTSDPLVTNPEIWCKKDNLHSSSLPSTDVRTPFFP